MDEQNQARAAVDEVLSSLSTYRIEKKDLTRQGKEYVPGGFGNVWIASLKQASSNEVTVAVKELRPAGHLVDRFRLAIRLARELKVWATFQHPNILLLLGFHLDDEFATALLISPYMAHGHVGEYLEKAKPEPLKRLQLALDTVEGLQYLHELEPPVCHGDLKSCNVLITDDIKAVLCDFGIAKVTETTSGLTTSEGLGGTTRYMSVELIVEKEAVLTLASDMWAWGCVFIEIVLDLMPHSKAKSNMAAVLRIMGGNKPVSPENLLLSENLRLMILSCWDAEPSRRPTASACYRTLREEVGRLEAER